jgi:NADH-quinone oxidoreductase subunit A
VDSIIAYFVGQLIVFVVLPLIQIPIFHMHSSLEFFVSPTLIYEFPDYFKSTLRQYRAWVYDMELDVFLANPQLQTYHSILLYILIAATLCIILATLAYILSLSTNQDTEKRSEYECGFEPFDSATRLPFDVHFYLVGILFLIFDVEIALLFPWVTGLRLFGWFGFFLMFGFLSLLGVGFFYEWKRGALIWPSRQYRHIYQAH